MKAKPSSSELWDQSRNLFYSARDPSQSNRRELATKGLRLAEEALKEDPKSSDALYWAVAHQGILAETGGLIEAMNAAKAIEKRLLYLREIDAQYGFGAADRILAHLYDVAPPFISIGSKTKSRQHLKRALDLGPEFPPNLLALARTLLNKGEKALARQTAKKVEASPYLESSPQDRDIWLAEAKKIIGKQEFP